MWSYGPPLAIGDTDIFVSAVAGVDTDLVNPTALQIKSYVLDALAIADVTDLQTELDGKAATAHTHLVADITDLAAELALKADASHTHLAADITDLQPLLDDKSDVGHTHLIADITDLQTELDGKAASTHAHVIADTTGLQPALDAKANTTHAHTIADVTGLQTDLDAKAAVVHTHVISDVTDLQTELDGKSATTHTHTSADITDASVIGISILTAVDAAAIATALGLGSAAYSDAGDFAATVDPIGIEDVTLLQDTLDAKAALAGATFTGRILLPAGSAVTPSVSFEGDNDVGIFNPAANSLGFATAGTEAARFDGGNRFIVGATASQQLLGTAQPRVQVHGTAVGTALSSITSWASAASTGAQLLLGHSRSGAIGTLTASLNGDTLGIITFASNDGTTWNDSSRILGKVDTVGNGSLSFESSLVAGSPIEKMRVEPHGTLVLGQSVATNLTGTSRLLMAGSQPAIAQTWTTSYGIFDQRTLIASGIGTLSQDNAFYWAPTTTSGLSLTTAVGFAADGITMVGGGTVTNVRGFHARSGLTMGTNNFGFYGDIGTAAARWNFYANGDAPNYFTGITYLPESYTTTTASAANLFINSAGRISRSTSMAAFKDVVEDMGLEYARKVLDFRPVFYKSKSPNDRKDWTFYGLIAEEVAAVEPRFASWAYPSKVVEISDGARQIVEDTDKPMAPDGVQYERIVTALILTGREARDEIAKLKQQMAEMSKALAKLTSK